VLIIKKINRFIILKVCYKYIHNIKVKLSPAYLILILITFNSIIVNFPLFGGRFLFKIKKAS